MIARRAALAAVMVVLASLLVACTAQGDSAQRWLADHDIVVSTDHSGSFAGFIENASIEGTLADDATDAQVRQLAIDASAYLAKDDGPGSLSMTLTRDGIAFAVDGDETLTAQAMDSWILIRDSGRAASALVRHDQAYVTVADRADMLDTYRELADASAAMTVFYQDDDGGFQLTGDLSCASIEANAALVDAVLADDSFASGRIEPCGATVLATGTSAGVLPAVAQLVATQASTGAQGIALSVVFDDERQLLFQAAAFQVALFVVTPAVLDYLGMISVLPATHSFVLGTDAVLHIVTTGAPATVRAAVTAALDPAVEGIADVIVEAGGLRVEASTIAAAEPLVKLVEEVAGLGYENAYFTATSAELTLVLYDDDFTLPQGSRFVDLLGADGLWAHRTVSILDYDHDGAVFVDGVAQATKSAVGNELVGYWDEHL